MTTICIDDDRGSDPQWNGEECAFIDTHDDDVHALEIGALRLRITYQTGFNILAALAEGLEVELYYRDAAGVLRAWTKHPKPNVVP